MTTRSFSDGFGEEAAPVAVANGSPAVESAVRSIGWSIRECVRTHIYIPIPVVLFRLSGNICNSAGVETETEK